MSKIALIAAPDAEYDKNCRQCQYLAYFNANIEADNIGDESITGKCEFLQLGREAKPMKKSEDKDRCPRVWFNTEYPFEAIDIFKRFINDREANNGIDQVSIDLQICQYTQQQGNTVADGKQGHVFHNMLGTIEEENNADEKQQVIIACHHMLGAQIDEWSNGRPIYCLHEVGVRTFDGVSHCDAGEQRSQHDQEEPGDTDPVLPSLGDKCQHGD